MEREAEPSPVKGDEEGSARSEGALPGPADHAGAPEPSTYDEVTLADLVDTLIRRRRVLAGIFLIILAGSILTTIWQEPVHEVSATITATNEREEVLSLITSQRFTNTVQDASDIDGSVTARLGPSSIPTGQQREMTLTFTAEGAAAAQQFAHTAFQVLDAEQDLLRNITWSKNWQTYYERAGRDEAQARDELQTLVDGMTYFAVIDAPGDATQVSPDARLNLALGTVLGVMLGVFAVFAVEWWDGYRRRGEKGN